MTETTLEGFRMLANAMAGDEPRDWEWIGPHMSQRMFGITEARAKGYAERHGGKARRMPTDADRKRDREFIDAAEKAEDLRIGYGPGKF